MRISRELEGARLNATETAELLNMDPGHFRRLVRRNFFPPAKRTAKGLPFYDHELLCQIAEIVKRRVGQNGEEIMFYRRKTNEQRRNQARRRTTPAESATDAYLEAVMEGCRQFGVAADAVNFESIRSALSAEFGQERPELGQAIPAVARRLLGS